jgi:hypothetical protein
MVAALHVTEAPTDIPAAIRAAKAELRTQIGDYQEVFAEAAMRREVTEIAARRERGEEVWPVVQFADVAASTVPPETVATIRRHGCAVVRGTFPRERAAAWDAELVSYLDDNDFMSRYRYLDNGEFSGLAAGKPSIYPIYWSGPQMQAREDANMAAVRCFLNGFWQHESEGRRWFDPAPTGSAVAPPALPPRGCLRIPTPARSSAGCCPPTARSSGTCSTATRPHTTRGMAPTARMSTSTGPR